MMRPVVRDGPRTDPLWLWPAGQVMPTGQVRQGKFREGKSPPAVFRFLEHDWHGRKPPALSPWIGPDRCQPNLQRSVLSMRSPPYEPSFAPATSKLGSLSLVTRPETAPGRVAYPVTDSRAGEDLSPVANTACSQREGPREMATTVRTERAPQSGALSTHNGRGRGPSRPDSTVGPLGVPADLS
jgi:hypothetical protein